MSLTIVVEPHPLLELGMFVIRAARPCAELATPAALAALAAPGASAPLAPSDPIKAAVRDLLRHGGYKPSGRSKPASEYLAAAFAKAEFPRINAMVDACNVVSLHAGLPISLVDVDRLDHSAALTIRIAPPGTSYVFNPSGQIIDASGLVCLYDAQGPTGTPVKDAQRTKTHDATVAALAIVWGTRALAGRAAETTRWYRALVGDIPGASLEDVTLA
jgi:DNA/RNA-binding domain of Phe-tRNA-synthetase-like protein